MSSKEHSARKEIPDKFTANKEFSVQFWEFCFLSCKHWRWLNSQCRFPSWEELHKTEFLSRNNRRKLQVEIPSTAHIKTDMSRWHLDQLQLRKHPSRFLHMSHPGQADCSPRRTATCAAVLWNIWRQTSRRLELDQDPDVLMTDHIPASALSLNIFCRSRTGLRLLYIFVVELKQRSSSSAKA